MHGDFWMVHGICLMPDGKPYAHAWVEEGNMTWNPCILDGEKGFAQSTIKDFYKLFQVQDFTRYNFDALFKLSAEIGHAPPPWEDKYRRLCRDYLPGFKPGRGYE